MLDRGEGEDWWSARARIVTDGRLLSVEVRPSDAFILAVIHEVRIFVVEGALERFAVPQDSGDDSGDTNQIMRVSPVFRGPEFGGIRGHTTKLLTQSVADSRDTNRY